MIIVKCDLPADALLRRYDLPGGFTDCYRVDMPGVISLERYVGAFYTTLLFKIERVLLSLGGHPSRDAEAAALARGQVSRFSAWTVEDRSDDQLLMNDASGRTCCWFKVAPTPGDGPARTSLYFGSAIIPMADSRTGHKSIGPVFKALLGVHHLYSRALLAATRQRLAHTRAMSA